MINGIQELELLSGLEEKCYQDFRAGLAGNVGGDAAGEDDPHGADCDNDGHPGFYQPTTYFTEIPL